MLIIPIGVFRLLLVRLDECFCDALRAALGQLLIVDLSVVWSSEQWRTSKVVFAVICRLIFIYSPVVVSQT